MYISSETEETIHRAEIKDTSYESQANFHWGKKKLKKLKKKKKAFSSSTNILQFTIWEQFLQFKACKSVEIDAIGIEVAPVNLSKICFN